jgi:hypothetical protein
MEETMHRNSFSAMMLVIGIISMTTISMAQEPLLINYQGQLADSGGNPVPDSYYFLTFRLYNDSTGLSNPFWTETHPRIPTSDGLFHVQLGSVTPFNLSALGEEPLFLEIQVGDQTLLPRLRFTAVPQAMYAQRLKGDIVTEPGAFLFRSSLGDSAISFRSDGITNAFTLNWPDPPEQHAVEINMGVDGQGSIKMFNPQPEPPASPILEVNTGIGGQASIKMFNPQPEPPAEPMLEISTIPGSNASIKMFNPQPEPPAHDPVMEMSTGIGGQASIKMFNPQPEPPAEPMLEISTIPGSSASFKMFNPQPEPPASPLLEMNTNIGGQASIKMFNPQPEPPANDPLLELNTSSLGGSFIMYSPQFGRPMVRAFDLDNTDTEHHTHMNFYHAGGVTPWLGVESAEHGGLLSLSNPNGVRTFDLDNTDTEWHPSMNFFHAGGVNSWLGVESSEHGGCLKLFDINGLATFDLDNTDTEWHPSMRFFQALSENPWFSIGTAERGGHLRLYDANMAIRFDLDNTDTEWHPSMRFFQALGENPWFSVVSSDSGGDISLFNSHAEETIRLSSDGKIGIGTYTPTTPLDVNGTAKMTGFQMPTSAMNGYVLTSDGSGVGSWQLATAGSDGDWTITGSNMYSAVPGNVGIGTTFPARKLHINDVMRLQPRASFPANPGEGDICVVYSIIAGNHIYCYLNGGWCQLD